MKIYNSMTGKKHTPETIEYITKLKQEQSGIKIICVETGEIFLSMGEASKIKNIVPLTVKRMPVCGGLIRERWRNANDTIPLAEQFRM